MQTTLEQKKNFILFSTIAFITGAILYTCLPYISNLIPSEIIFEDTLPFFITRFFIGGYLIMTIIVAILFASYFYAWCSKTMKILSIIFLCLHT